MQTNPVGTTWTLGNHALTAAELAAGLPERDPFFGEDGLPADPDEVRLTVTDAAGATSTYGWPAAAPGDAGVLEQQETGRFFVAVTPLEGEDGLWRWWLRGAMTLGTAASDQDVFYVQREIAPGVEVEEATVTPQLLLQLAGDTAAIAIALLGWFVAVRSCRSTTQALLEENRRLIEALARALEDGAHRSPAP